MVGDLGQADPKGRTYSPRIHTGTSGPRMQWAIP